MPSLGGAVLPVSWSTLREMQRPQLAVRWIFGGGEGEGEDDDGDEVNSRPAQ